MTTAARVKVLSPAAILARLERRLPLLTHGSRDLPERQRTLRAAIAWSDELLTEEERRAFEALSVFAGGWTVEAAEEVAEVDLDLLEALVERSLVRSSDGRFSMLETIREYANEQLRVRGGAEELHARHARFSARWPSARSRSWRGPSRPAGCASSRPSTTTSGPRSAGRSPAATTSWLSG